MDEVIPGEDRGPIDSTPFKVLGGKKTHQENRKKGGFSRSVSKKKIKVKLTKEKVKGRTVKHRTEGKGDRTVNGKLGR